MAKVPSSIKLEVLILRHEINTNSKILTADF